MDRFLWKLNGYTNTTQFTLETEKEGGMPFLGMLAKMQERLKLQNKAIGDVIMDETEPFMFGACCVRVFSMSTLCV